MLRKQFLRNLLQGGTSKVAFGLAAVCCLHCLAAAGQAAPDLRNGLRSSSRRLQQDSLSGGVTQYEWHLTVAQGAPDCFLRDVITVNRQFQPSIEVTQGDFLQVPTQLVLSLLLPEVSDGL